MDGYFDLMSDDGDSGGNESLLAGIVPSLHDAALDAFTAVDTMFTADPFAFGLGDPSEIMDEWKSTIRAKFLNFSDADIEINSRVGLQGIIDDLGSVRETFLRDSKTDLEHTHDLLTDWRGEAANDVKYYVRKLADDYELVATKLSILQSDVVAAREMVASGRGDLENLSGTILRAAEQYRETEEANDRGASEVLSDGFAGAVTGLLAVAAAVPTGGMSMVAAGTLIAGSAAGTMAVGSVADQPVQGDHPADLYQDFIDGVDEIEEGIRRAADQLVHDIGALEMPVLQKPPDVSPGSSFDPDSFYTGELPQDVEDNVRESDVDIEPYEPGDRQRDKERADDNVSDAFS